MAARKAIISAKSTPWGRKWVHVQFLELWAIAKFHAQIWQFWKLARISKIAARRAKINSIRPPGVERAYTCNFWNFCQWPSFMLIYGKFENWPVSAWNLGQWPSWFSSRASRPMGLLLFCLMPGFSVLISSALSYCTAELLSSRRRPSSVRRPSVRQSAVESSVRKTHFLRNREAN